MKQSTIIKFRVTEEAKEKYTLLSKKAQKGLSRMIKDLLDMEVKKEKRKEQNRT